MKAEAKFIVNELCWNSRFNVMTLVTYLCSLPSGHKGCCSFTRVEWL